MERKKKRNGMQEGNNEKRKSTDMINHNGRYQSVTDLDIIYKTASQSTKCRSVFFRIFYL